MQKFHESDTVDEGEVIIENRDKVIALIIGYLSKVQYNVFSLNSDT